MFAKVEPLVGGVDDDGVVGEAAGFEFVENDADAFVHRANRAEVVFDVALVFPLRDFFVVELACFHFGEEGLIFRFVGCVPSFLLFLGHATVFAIGQSASEVLGIKIFAVKFHVVSPIHVFGDGHLLLL